MIPNGQNDSKTHVDDAKDDGNLHLVGVQIRNLVLAHLPDGIDAERVRNLGIVAVGWVGNEHFVPQMLQLVIGQIHFVRRAEYVDRFGKDVVVNQAGVDGKQTHEEHDITAAKADSPNLNSNQNR